MTDVSAYAAFASDQFQLNGGVPMLRDKTLRRLDQGGVECARQALVAGHEHQQNTPFGALCEKRILAGALIPAGRRRHVREHLPQQRPVWSRGDHAVLRAAQFRRRDHLHGLGDLLRVFDRADAPPDIDQARHGLSEASPRRNGP